MPKAQQLSFFPKAKIILPKDTPDFVQMIVEASNQYSEYTKTRKPECLLIRKIKKVVSNRKNYPKIEHTQTVDRFSDMLENVINITIHGKTEDDIIVGAQVRQQCGYRIQNTLKIVRTT